MYKELYDRELVQRENLRNAVATPIGLLTVFGGLLGAMSQSISLQFTPAFFVFLISGGIACIALLVAIVYLGLAYHAHEYKILPNAALLSKYEAELRAWYSSYGEGSDNTDRDFQEAVRSMYVAAADHNMIQNLRKAQHLYYANGTIFIVAVFVFLTFLPYSYHRRSMMASPQQVEITNIEKLGLHPVLRVEPEPKGEFIPSKEGRVDTSVNVNAGQDAPKPPKPEPPPLQTTRDGKVPKAQ